MTDTQVKQEVSKLLMETGQRSLFHVQSTLLDRGVSHPVKTAQIVCEMMGERLLVPEWKQDMLFLSLPVHSHE